MASCTSELKQVDVTLLLWVVIVSNTVSRLCPYWSFTLSVSIAGYGH